MQKTELWMGVGFKCFCARCKSTKESSRTTPRGFLFPAEEQKSNGKGPPALWSSAVCLLAEHSWWHSKCEWVSEWVCVFVCVHFAVVPHSPDILQWMALMNNNPTRGARVVFLQILHKAASADWRRTAEMYGYSSSWAHTHAHRASFIQGLYL